MANKQSATSTWEGTLKEGNGTITLPQANITSEYDFGSRFEDGNKTNPEELLAGAISGCFSMYLSALLSNEDIGQINRIQTTAQVQLDANVSPPKVTTIDLNVEADIEQIDNARFQELIQQTENECPVANLFQGATVSTTSALLANS